MQAGWSEHCAGGLLSAKAEILVEVRRLVEEGSAAGPRRRLCKATKERFSAERFSERFSAEKLSAEADARLWLDLNSTTSATCTAVCTAVLAQGAQKTQDDVAAIQQQLSALQQEMQSALAFSKAGDSSTAAIAAAAPTDWSTQKETELVAAVERRLIGAIRAELTTAGERAGVAVEKARAVEMGLGEVGLQLQEMSAGQSAMEEQRLADLETAKRKERDLARRAYDDPPASEHTVLALREQLEALSARVGSQPGTPDAAAAAASAVAADSAEADSQLLATLDETVGELTKKIDLAVKQAEDAAAAASLATGDAATAFAAASAVEVALGEKAKGGDDDDVSSSSLIERIDVVAASTRRVDRLQVTPIFGAL